MFVILVIYTRNIVISVPCSRKDSHTVHQQKPRPKPKKETEIEREIANEDQTEIQTKKEQQNNNVNRNNVEPEGPLESTTGDANSFHSIPAHVLLMCVCLCRTLMPPSGWIL